MAVAKQLLESGGTTSSFERTVNALNEEGTKQAMIRLFNEAMRPAYYFEEDSKNGSTSSIGESASVVKDFGNTSNSKALELRFLNGISTPVATGIRIEGKDDKLFVVALVDGMSGKIVKTGAEAAMEVEIVVLDGDTNNDEAENWTSGEWNKKKVLQGKTCVKMEEGVVLLDDISFTQNKVWQKNRNCRLGVRPVNAIFSASVKAGKTQLFLLVDKRKHLYVKREIPFLSDHVYRLREISRRGVCYKLLCDANIKTVMDLLTLHAINPERLKDILNVHANRWKTIIDHAQKCKDDKGVYLYHHPRDGQKSHGVVFNISGQLVGLVADSQFVPSDKIPIDKRVDAQKLVVSSSEHWEEVVSFNDQPSLISHLQSHTTLNSLRGNLNVVIPQTFNTRHPTSRASPQVTTQLFPTGWCINNQSNRECDSAAGVCHNQIQSPKRSASEYAISNSPKKLRYDRPQISPYTPCIMTNTTVTGTLPRCQNTNNLRTSATTEDDSWLQYIDLSQWDISAAQRWKRVWSVVGWISIYSKVRKRRTNFSGQLFGTSYDETVFVISASIQRAQT